MLNGPVSLGRGGVHRSIPGHYSDAGQCWPPTLVKKVLHLSEGSTTNGVLNGRRQGDRYQHGQIGLRKTRYQTGSFILRPQGWMAPQRPYSQSCLPHQTGRDQTGPWDKILSLGQPHPQPWVDRLHLSLESGTSQHYWHYDVREPRTGRAWDARIGSPMSSPTDALALARPAKGACVSMSARRWPAGELSSSDLSA